MLGVCKGPPPIGQYGGRGQQLVRLERGIHPRSAVPLPVATRLDGSPLEGTKRYEQRDATNDTRRRMMVDQTTVVPNALFSPYVPEVFREAKPVEGKSARMKMDERLARVRSTPAAVPGVRRRLRTKQCIAYPIRN